MTLDKKTSDEADAGTLDGTELVRIAKGGGNARTTAQAIADLGYQSPLTTKGDIIVRGSDGNDHALPAGADGQFLSPKSSNPLGVEYVDPTTIGATNPPPVNPQVSTTYTLALTDAPDSSANCGIVTMTNAAANTIVIPSDDVVDFPVGTQIEGIQLGTGQTAFAGDGGDVDLVSASTLTARVQNSSIRALKLAANLWHISGDLT